MRISHWRSDVCSLDLYRRRRRRTRRIGPAAVSGCRSPAPPLRTRPGTERLRLKNSLNSIRAAAMGRPVQEHSMTEPREIIDFWFGAPGSDAYGVFRDVWFERDGAFDAAFDERRSEEHTSELQSLMRISYAVFCLTKKRKRNTYTVYST